MKKKKAILALVLVVAIVAAFAACSKSSKDDKGSTSQITAAVTDSNGEAVTDENGVIVTEKVGGEVVTDKSGMAVTEVVTQKGGQTVTDKAGKAVTQVVTEKSTASSKSGDKTSTTKKSNKPAAPSAPSSLKAGSVTQTSLKLTWSGKANGYQIQSSTDRGSHWTTLEKTYKSKSYTAKKLSSYTDYIFRVRAYNQNSNGTSYSKWTVVSVKTKANEKSKRYITVSVKLPSSGGSDTLNIYVDGKLVKSQKVNFDGSTYKYKTTKKYEGLVTIKAEFSSKGKETAASTDKDSCYLSLDDKGIVIVDGSDD